MSVSIQVAVRCRPFVCDDELGVSMFQNSEDEGEINLITELFKEPITEKNGYESYTKPSCSDERYVTYCGT